MKRIAIHNTAVKRGTFPQLLGVNRYHKDKWGMKSSLGWYVGYNEFVDVDGKRTKCRTEGEETVANRGHNCDAPERCDIYSVAFALDGDTQVFNKAQEDALRDIVAEHDMWGLTLHRDIQPNRTCPGKNITLDYLNNLLSDDPDNVAEKKAVSNGAIRVLSEALRSSLSNGNTELVTTLITVLKRLLGLK